MVLRPRIALALSLLLAACSTVDPATLDVEGKPLKDREPAPYRIAVLPVDFDNQSPSSDLQFSMDRTEFRSSFIRHLKELNAATEVFAAEPSDSLDADLILTPRLQGDRAFQHEGVSDNWLAGGTFWLLTWIGGLFVEDSTYTTRMQLLCNLTSRYRTAVPEQPFSFRSRPVDCTYADRNTVLSLRFLECLIIPPFWTSDNTEKTSESLSEQTSLGMAASVAKFLKTDFGTSIKRKFGALKLVDPPVNGGQLGSALKVKISSRTPLDSVTIRVNENKEIVIEPLHHVMVGDDCETTIDVDAAQFRQGENRVLIASAVSQQELFTRTILVNRK